MACRLYNTERCLQHQLFNRPNFGVHFSPCHISAHLLREPGSCLFLLCQNDFECTIGSPLCNLHKKGISSYL